MHNRRTEKWRESLEDERREKSEEYVIETSDQATFGRLWNYGKEGRENMYNGRNENGEWYVIELNYIDPVGILLTRSVMYK